MSIHFAMPIVFFRKGRTRARANTHTHTCRAYQTCLQATHAHLTLEHTRYTRLPRTRALNANYLRTSCILCTHATYAVMHEKRGLRA